MNEGKKIVGLTTFSIFLPDASLASIMASKAVLCILFPLLLLLNAPLYHGLEVPILYFYGTVLDDRGDPVSAAQVQFWHADYHGNYDHPDNPYNGWDLVSDFQYFGTAVTDAYGKFKVTTFRPGIYPARPMRHIHYKVFWRGREILTSQFYFADENPINDPMLLLNLFFDEDGNESTAKTIVIDMGRGGSQKTTPSQTEGPYYPVVRFFDMGSDLTEGIGEFGTIFPSWGASGTWFPTGVTDFPTTFAPTEEELVTPTNPPTAATNATASPATMPPSDVPVDPATPTNAPAAASQTDSPVSSPTDAPISPTDDPVAPSIAPVDPSEAPVAPTSAPVITSAPTIKPTNTITVAPMEKPTSQPPTIAPTVPVPQPPSFVNSTGSTQETIVSGNITVPTNATNATQILPTSAPELAGGSGDRPAQKEKTHPTRGRMTRRGLRG